MAQQTLRVINDFLHFFPTNCYNHPTMSNKSEQDLMGSCYIMLAYYSSADLAAHTRVTFTASKPICITIYLKYSILCTFIGIYIIHIHRSKLLQLRLQTLLCLTNLLLFTTNAFVYRRDGNYLNRQ